MEMAYIQAENLKHKRTFTKTLIVLAPFVTALMNFFAPLWFQLNSYNWWYLLLCGEFHFPGAKSVGRFCNISYQRNSPDNRNLAGCGRNSLYCHCKPMGSSAVLMVIKKSWYLCHGYS